MIELNIRRRFLRSLRSLAQDVGYAIRTLHRSPGFAIGAISILALGIGANTAIFSLVNALLLQPLPFPDPDRLVVIWADASEVGGTPRTQASPALYVDWRSSSRSFTEIAALENTSYNLTGTAEPERLVGSRTTANLFLILGMQPIVGRTLLPADEAPDASPVIVIGEELWRRRFGGDPEIVGGSMILDGVGHTIVGVVPSDFGFPDPEAQVWVPASFTPQELARRDAYYLYLVARLRPGIALSEARAEMSALTASLGAENPENRLIGVTVESLHDQLVLDARPVIILLLGAVGMVLLIACTNTANLLLTRSFGRRKELALRQALGAGRGRILRQLLTESAFLAGCGAVAGLAIANFSFGYLPRLIPGGFPTGAGPELDWVVLVFTVVVALLTALLFGAGPAWIGSGGHLEEALRKGGPRAMSGQGGRVRTALVVGELTLTVVLIAGAGLLLRSYSEVLAVDPGFDPENLLVAETVLSPAQYDDPSTRSAFYAQVLERVQALPGVTGAGYVNYPPLTFDGGRAYVAIEGRPPPAPEEVGRNIHSDRVVTADYLRTLGVPLIRGRHFDERDVAGSPLSMVINQAMAETHWPGQDPLGARLRMGNAEGDGPWFTVVGVVGDIRQMGLDVPAEPEFYLAASQVPINGPFFWPRHLVVRTQGDPMALGETVREAIWQVDPEQPVSGLRSMDQIIDTELANRSTQLTLLGGFAALTLLLASIGLYGVLAFTVRQRTAEIGLKVALGAEPGRLARAVLRNALLLAGVGIALGTLLALGLARLLGSFLFEISPTDPTTFVAVAVLLLLVTAGASYLPARRAARVDPVAALTAE